MTSGGPPSDRTRIIRGQPDADVPPPTESLEPQTGIIRRHPTGSFPVLPDPTDDTQTGYLPRATPLAVGSPGTAPPSAAAAAATAAVSIVSGWATAVIATSLITGWWDTDKLFCVAIGSSLRCPPRRPSGD